MTLMYNDVFSCCVAISKKREVLPDLAPLLWHSFGKPQVNPCIHSTTPSLTHSLIEISILGVPGRAGARSGTNTLFAHTLIECLDQEFNQKCWQITCGFSYYMITDWQLNILLTNCIVTCNSYHHYVCIVSYVYMYVYVHVHVK